MFYLLYGKDTHTAREKLHSLLEVLFKKRPSALYYHVTAETFEEYSLVELISAQGLFEQKYIVVFDGVLSNASSKDAVMSCIKEFGLSEHVFIFLEEKLDKKTVTRFEKHAEKVQLFDTEKKKKEVFNVFSLTDALGTRNRKELWVLYQKAKQHNVADEEIHGILFWQIKTMMLTSGAKSAGEAGLNPFVFRKSQSFLKKYSEDELRDTSSRLIELSHDARRVVHDFGVALERFILSV